MTLPLDDLREHLAFVMRHGRQQLRGELYQWTVRDVRCYAKLFSEQNERSNKADGE